MSPCRDREHFVRYYQVIPKKEVWAWKGEEVVRCVVIVIYVFVLLLTSYYPTSTPYLLPHSLYHFSPLHYTASKKKEVPPDPLCIVCARTSGGNLLLTWNSRKKWPLTRFLQLRLWRVLGEVKALRLSSALTARIRTHHVPSLTRQP